MKSLLLMALLLCLLVVSGSAIADQPETETMTNFDGLEFTVTFDSNTEKIWVEVENPTGEEKSFKFHVKVDGRFIVTEEVSLQTGEAHSYRYDLSSGVDLASVEHTVEFIGGQHPLTYTYTKDITPSNDDGYSIPKITNITFETELYGGESRTVLNITAHNPSSRIWMPLIRAHTLETPGFYSPIRLGPNSTESTTILLRENAGELVAGEVRMYKGKISDTTGAFDQVEIKGRSDGTVERTHEEYVPVVPPWEDEDDYYVYENESVHREKVGAPETLKESPVAWIAGVLVLLFGFRGFRKHRS